MSFNSNLLIPTLVYIFLLYSNSDVEVTVAIKKFSDYYTVE